MAILKRNTVAELELPAGKDDKVFWDEVLHGFGLRVRIDSDGKIQKSFVMQYRFEHDQRRAKLGDCKKMDADRARKLAQKILDQVEEGTDPRADAETKRKADRLIFSSVAQQFIDHKQQTSRPNTHTANVQYLTGPYFRQLHSTALTKITTSHVSECLDAVAKNSGEASARQARRHLAAVFTWAMKRGHCTANPVIATEDYRAKSSDGRERHLTDIEIASVWNSVDSQRS
jgi:hypothetical protein